MQDTLTTYDFRLIGLLTPEQAYAFRVVPAEKNGSVLLVQGDEHSLSRKAALQLVLGCKVKIQQIETSRVDELLAQYYPGYIHEVTGPRLEATGSDAVQLVDRMIQEAADMKASDIHVECYEDTARVRFRWEGVLIEKYEVPYEAYNALISRMKILADLDISERRLPQDGRIQFNHDTSPIDIRVSTVPGKYGEKVVMRLLTRSQEHLQLSRLGMEPSALEAWKKASSLPNGIVLITGPTGSGKTTTLYATLNTLNTPEKNILTVEDPVEYNLTGINQVQVKEGIGLSFDAVLRAFLRQDPDIIMVGEIRDKSTAQIAIRAALTGHLVLSTLHTNSAWDAVNRLVDMGIDRYLIAASLRMVVAQRLVRKLCSHCKEEAFEASLSKEASALNIDRHWKPVGCSQCYFTGYSSRRAVYEMIPVNAEAREAIKQGLPYDLSQTGLPGLRENLRALVMQGETSREEALSHLSDL